MMDLEGDGAKKAPGKKFGGLGLNLNDSAMKLDQSYELSDAGTFKKEGFRINKYGLETPKSELTASGIDTSKAGSVPTRTRFDITPEHLYDMGTLGKGAGGYVKKALHVPSLQLLALKTIDVFDKAKRNQLIHELKALNAGTGSPYIVSFLGAYYDNSKTNLALEFMNRGSLQDVINKYGPCSEQVLASIAKQSLLGLQHLHGLHKVHRDIKPANILVDVRGQVKISDFGILAELQNTQAKCTTFVGTAVYMSPERIQSQQYSYPSDTWSLGMTLMTCALGKVPVDTDSGYWGLLSNISEKPLPPLPDNFSNACKSFIASCLQKNPARRGRISDLLKHPFVSKVDPNKPADWPFPTHGTDQEEADLKVILNVMRERLYPRGSKDYKRSLFDIARFQRIGGQLGFNPTEIQNLFEQLLEDDDEGDEDEDEM